MKVIALRYEDIQLSDLSFNPTNTNQVKFATIGLTSPINNLTAVSGELLNGRLYKHKLYSRKQLDITVTSDEIDEVNFEFLQNFWKANYQYISIAQNGNFGNYSEVITESGLFPVSYIDDLIDLPEITFTLQYAEVN